MSTPGGEKKDGEPADAAVRSQALDVTQSFIVQAPAGSGKTELLTRRVLKLLTLVDEPEEVLSITFTRKAASEMRARVVETLQSAALGIAPDNAYQLEGFKLAQAVLQRDAERDWQLLKNTQRLTLRTIDSLCTTFAHRLPVVSELGGPAGLVDDARPIYRRAAEQLLDHRADELDLLLLQLGNRQEHVQGLLAELLANRDQWGGYVTHSISHNKLRELLEAKLQQLVESRLQELAETMPTGTTSRLTALLAQVAPVQRALLADAGADTSQVDAMADALAAINDDLGTSVEELPAWRALANALLTANAPVTMRKPGGIKRPAFPVSPKDADLVGVSVEELKARKERMIGLLEDLGDVPELVELLDEVRGLPSGKYDDKDWALLSQLLTMLPKLLSELQEVFAEYGVVDFVEMTQRARRALGNEDEPTDLALALDMKIKHVLVDEFQDTSRTQFELYKLLVAGWQPDEGRTFFAVGDPMQSIYRFRGGDVTLFTHAREFGVGSVVLQPLTLTVNFRAASAIVEWVNDAFTGVFPEDSDDVTGAVSYAPSIAHLSSAGAVALHPFIDKEPTEEAECVAQLTRQALGGEDSQSSVAILLRSRSQAAPVFAALQALGIKYQSVDLELLGDRHVVRDLVSLALALRYPHDRLHWLTLLRAPWCGLTLHDLHFLMDGAKHQTVFDLLHENARLVLLSEDGQTRVKNFLQIISPAVERSSRGALMPWVEACWLQLGGPVVCSDAIDLDAAERCIAQLRKLEQDGQLWQPSVLHTSMESLYAASSDTDARVQVMTLHKSKGLEFDTVILPSLDRKPRGDQQKILNWFESGSDADERLLLAPISERGLSGKAIDPINALVRRAGQLCDEQEKLRLLYVACTRAKKQLHLLASAKTRTDGELRDPEKRSLLNPLWPLFAPVFQRALETMPILAAETDQSADQSTDQSTDQTAEFGTSTPTVLPSASSTTSSIEEVDTAEVPSPELQRLPTAWIRPAMDVFAWPEDSVRKPPKEPQVEFLWAGTLARDIGTAVHEQLQLMSVQAPQENQLIKSRVYQQLKNMGVAQEQLDRAVNKVMDALGKTRSDERGQWILSQEHSQAKSEWELSAPVNGIVNRIVIDRTFVDNDVRWIVDYKTGDHTGADKEAFLDNEQERYTDQLQRYAAIVGRFEKRKIRAALYFPLMQAWREVSLPDKIDHADPLQSELF